jgi:LysR family transcriptional regulator (chromosome initiation inhibitor)
MLDYALINALTTVVREGSFERAAKALHVTPSAVSQRIKALEERMGTVLVVRGQPCTATAAGLSLCRHADMVGLLESELSRTLPNLVLEGEATPLPPIRVAVNADSLATWFMRAFAAFADPGTALLDIVLDDQDHTADWLRQGQVLAAVTATPEPVQGCKSVYLGHLRYAATASPAFMKRYFSQGVNARSLAGAPALVFNAKDRLQHTWISRHLGQPLQPPMHRLPSSQAFVEGALMGIGWGMNPVDLVAPHLQSGALVELMPAQVVDVALYWQHTRLVMQQIERLTRQVLQAAASSLVQRRPEQDKTA